MLNALKSWLVKAPLPREATQSYIALLAAARNPFFYDTLHVPDTLDGRFELIVLHLFILQQRLIAWPEATDFNRHLGEAFIDDMERSVREMGVMDPGVGKRVKKMAAAYHGHIQAYHHALGDKEMLKAALARNVYGTVGQGEVATLDAAAQWLVNAVQRCGQAPLATVLNGNYAWPDPASLLGK